MSTTIGPEKGHLVIIGGNLQSTVIYQRIVDLAGGRDAPLVIVPTAGGEQYDSTFPHGFHEYFENITILHTYDRSEADSDDFMQPILQAKAVFFAGGRQWRLVDAYAGTKTERAFQSVLDRGGVIAGSSAGASIQGTLLVRGDTEGNQTMLGDHQKGFGYISAAIDQHVITRNRHFDLLQILDKHAILGLGIDEDTALIVHGNHAEVVGGYVLIYDGKFWSEEGFEQKKLPSPMNRFFFLKQGDAYDLGQRKVLSERVSTG